MNNTIKKIIGWTVYFLVIIGLIFGIPKAMVYVLETPYPMAAITSGSMWPELKQGDFILILGIKSKNDIKLGDILVYKNDRGFTIHRAIEFNGDTVITKGDANNVSDPPVKYENVVGKAMVWNGKALRIPILGNISIAFNKKNL